MSYRDEKQSLKEPLHKICEGIKEFTEAVYHRSESDEWTVEHIDHINQIMIRLLELRPELLRTKQENW